MRLYNTFSIPAPESLRDELWMHQGLLRSDTLIDVVGRLSPSLSLGSQAPPVP